MLLLKQNTIIKEQINQNNAMSELKREFKTKNNKKYKVKAIMNSVVYGKKINNQIQGLYYLVLWKSYLKEKKT